MPGGFLSFPSNGVTQQGSIPNFLKLVEEDKPDIPGNMLTLNTINH
jgi:hypothetical protein